jgi:two-component system sensor kinase FixL
LSDFAYVVSHDLKAPLRGINSLAEWLRTDYGSALGSEGAHLVDLLQSRVARMNALIEGILAYSRAGRERKHRVNLDLNALISNVWDLLNPPAEAKLDLPDKLPRLYLDATQAAPKIDVSCVPRKNYWKFTVSDNGPGIEERYRDKVFQIFQTLNPRDEIESTGVGLSIVKKIVENLGGSIWITSEPGQGASFHFTTPRELSTKPTKKHA